MTVQQIEDALRLFIPQHIDYDIHKNLEGDEDGVDDYPDLAEALFDSLSTQSLQ